MSAYLTAVLADSPVHYWRFADPGGILAHDIGSSPIALIGSAQVALGYTGPISDGGSFVDNSASNYNSAGASIGSQTSPFSYEMWVWPVAAVATQRYIFAWDGSTPNAAQMFWNAAGTVEAHVNGVSSGFTGTVSLRAWHHLVATYDSTTLKLYLDGSLSISHAVAGPITVNRPIGIGAEPGGGTLAFEGAISEVAIYSTTLSAARVSAHFSAADQVFQPPVFNGAGGVPGGLSSSTPYLSLLQQILNAVKRTF